MSEKFPSGPNVPRHPGIETREQGIAAHDEKNIYSILFRGTELYLEKGNEWRERDPKTVLDEMVARLPSKPRIVSREVAEQEKAVFRTRDEEFGDVTELEIYTLWKTLMEDKSAPYFSGTDHATDTPDSFAPAQSIHCMRDTVRTKKFMTAVGNAVEAAAEHRETVEVCDAGSGAIPILGIYAALSSPKARVTCIENNLHAAQIARAAVKAFGVGERVTVEQRDATRYVPRRKIDVLVSETMDTALIHEPLCAILNQLQPHTNRGAVILPTSVETFAAAVPVRELDEAQEFVHLLGNYIARIDVDWIKTGLFVPGLDMREIGATLPVPYTNEPVATLITSKVTLGTDSLDMYDSVISTPQSVQRRRPGGFERRTFIPRRGESMKIAYAPGTQMTDIYLRTF